MALVMTGVLVPQGWTCSRMVNADGYAARPTGDLQYWGDVLIDELENEIERINQLQTPETRMSVFPFPTLQKIKVSTPVRPQPQMWPTSWRQ